jgi:TonB family protein
MDGEDKMDSKEPMRDDELSALLRKWQVDAAPLSLEASVFRARLQIRFWRPIVAVAFALTVMAAAEAWFLTSRSAVPLAVKSKPVLPNPPIPEAMLPQSTPVHPLKPQSDFPPKHREVTQVEFSWNDYQATPFTVKPAPQVVQQQVQVGQDASGLARVYRVGNGVSSPGVIEKQEPQYSDEARAARLAGKSVISLVIDENGASRNIRTMRFLGLGLDEKAVEAIGRWKFKPGMREGMPVAVAATVEVNFHLDDLAIWRVTRALFAPPDSASRPVLVQAAYPADLGSNLNDSVSVSFDVDNNGIPINVRAQSLAGPKLESEAIAIVSGWLFRPGTKGGKPVSVPATFDFIHGITGEVGTTRLRVGGQVQHANLVRMVPPAYPREAKASGVQGIVKLQVRIDRDGHVTEAMVISGDSLLAAAAIEAVKQWLYRPTLLNGDPVEVETEVDVNFTLSQ